MKLLFAFLPFLAFVVADRILGASIGLALGAATAAVLLVRDVWLRRQPPKLMEIGALLMFGALSLYMLWAPVALSVWAVRSAVDAGVLGLVLLSLAVGRPFTLAYVAPTQPGAPPRSPAYLRAHYAVASVWALALFAVLAADVAVMRQVWPSRIGVLLIVASLWGALEFTRWYPEAQRRAHHRTAHVE